MSEAENISPELVARDLSDKQRAALKTLPAPGAYRDRVFVGVYRYRSYGSIWRKSAAHFDAMLSLESLGVVERKVSRGETLWRPTRPFGLSVLAALKQGRAK